MVLIVLSSVLASGLLMTTKCLGCGVYISVLTSWLALRGVHTDLGGGAEPGADSEFGSRSENHVPSSIRHGYPVFQPRTCNKRERREQKGGGGRERETLDYSSPRYYLEQWIDHKYQPKLFLSL